MLVWQGEDEVSNSINSVAGANVFSVYNVADGSVAARVRLDPDYASLSSACFNAAGTAVFYATGGKIYEYTIATGTQTALLLTETSGIVSLAASHDGSTLGYYSGQMICLYNLKTNTIIKRFNGNNYTFNSLAFVNGDKDVATDGPIVYNFNGVIVAQQSESYNPIAVSPDETKIIYFDSSLTIHCRSSSNLASVWTSGIASVNGGSASQAVSYLVPLSVTNDEKNVLLCIYDGIYWYIESYSMSNGAVLPSAIEATPAIGDYAPFIAASPTTNQFLLGPSYDVSDAQMWTHDTSKGTGSLNGTFFAGVTLKGQSPTFTNASETIGGAAVPVVSTDTYTPSGNFQELRNAKTGAYLATLPTETSVVSPDGKYILGINGNEVDVYNASSHAQIASITEPAQLGTFAEWGGGSSRIAVTDQTNTYTLSFDGASLKNLYTFDDNDVSQDYTDTWAFKLSPDGTKIAFFVTDYGVAVYDAASGGELFTVPTITDESTADDISFSTNGRIGIHETIFSFPNSTSIFRTFTISGNSVTQLSNISFNYSQAAVSSDDILAASDGTLSPDGATVVIGFVIQGTSSDTRQSGSVRLYNATTGALQSEWDNQFIPDVLSEPNYNSSFDFSANSSTALWISGGAMIAVQRSNVTTQLSLGLNPSTVTGGSSSTGTVTVSQSSSTAQTVSLSSSSSSAKVPASVTIAAGAKTATFTITTSAVTSNSSATITAKLGSASASSALTVDAATLSSLTLNPTTVTGGSSSTGTVTLTGPAPSGGMSVTLSSSNSSAKAPASLTIVAGAKTATFTITTSSVPTNASATITAKIGSVSKTSTLTVDAAALSSVALNPTTVVGGSSSTGTVTLTGPAPTGGLKITLSSSNSSAKVPASVTIAAGAKTGTFTVATATVTANTTATITGKLGSVSKTATLTIDTASLSSVTVSPSKVVGGANSTGTVTLTGAAPTGGVKVALSSSNSNAKTPASVTVAAGAKTATFAITTVAVTANTTATITGKAGSVSKTSVLTIDAATLSSLTVNPTTVVGSSSTTVTGKVTLSGVAPAGGITVKVASSNSKAASVPSTVKISAGSSSATFTVTHYTVSSNQSVTLTAQLGSTTCSAKLAVNH